MSNMSINMSELIASGLNKMICVIVCEVVEVCGSVHNFDAVEMLRNLNVCDMRVKMNVSKKVKVVKEKVVKEKVVVVKSKLPLPFNGSLKEGCCSALRQNQGLYTQCDTVVSETIASESGFCKKCGPSPIYGTIKQRLDVGIMEYRDPKGKAPIPFAKIMSKLKVSREEVELEAGKLNITLNDIHFVQEEMVEKKEKGRPKKPRRKIELADDSTDLFAALVAKANDSFEDDISDLSCDEKSSMAESIIDSVLDKVSVVSENNEKKAEKSAAKQAEKAEKEAAKEAAKQALIDKKANELAEKEAAKQALIDKKANELAEKEAAKQALIQKKADELAKKDAAKQALIQKKAAELAEKESAIQKKESEKKPAVTKAKKNSSDSEKEKITKAPKKAEKVEVEVEVEEEQDVVKRFEFQGVKYLKSKNTGVIYNMDQDVIGHWNEQTSKIDFKVDCGSEEEEDEYDV